jgi:ABC-2 type transport system ATP-binding protein
LITLSYRELRGELLQGVTLELEPGVHAVLGAPSDGTDELIRVSAGISVPRAGIVRVAGADPARQPALRRRIGSLLLSESLVPARSVEDAVARVLSLRGQPEPDARGLLAAFQLERLRDVPVRALTAEDVGAVALALALAVREPALLALHEPLARATSLGVERVREALAHAAAGGAVVLCTTASPRDATLLSSGVLLLERGLLGRYPAPALTQLVPGHSPELRVTTPDARRLAAALAAEPDVVRVVLDEAAEPNVVRVQAADPTAAARAIARVVVRERFVVHALHASVPELESIRAATAALASVAHAQAQAAALAYYRPVR